MKQTNSIPKKPHGRILPLNEMVEGHLSFSESFMSFEMVRSIITGNSKNQKSKLPKSQRELFNAFYEEQQRLYRLAEINYLKKYLKEQRNQVNKIASYLKKRNSEELKTYGSLPVMISSIKEKQLNGAPTNKFKITNNIKDMKKKVVLLDDLLSSLRTFINYYEMEDYKRWDMKNGGGFDARMSKLIRKGLRKVV